MDLLPSRVHPHANTTRSHLVTEDEGDAHVGVGHLLGPGLHREAGPVEGLCPRRLAVGVAEHLFVR